MKRKQNTAEHCLLKKFTEPEKPTVDENNFKFRLCSYSKICGIYHTGIVLQEGGE